MYWKHKTNGRVKWYRAILQFKIKKGIIVNGRFVLYSSGAHMHSLSHFIMFNINFMHFLLYVRDENIQMADWDVVKRGNNNGGGVCRCARINWTKIIIRIFVLYKTNFKRICCVKQIRIKCSTNEQMSQLWTAFNFKTEFHQLDQ